MREKFAPMHRSRDVVRVQWQQKKEAKHYSFPIRLTFETALLLHPSYFHYW